MVLMAIRPILSYVAIGMTRGLLTWNSLNQDGRDKLDFTQLPILFCHVGTPCQEAFHVIIHINPFFHSPSSLRKALLLFS